MKVEMLNFAVSRDNQKVSVVFHLPSDAMLWQDCKETDSTKSHSRIAFYVIHMRFADAKNSPCAYR